MADGVVDHRHFWPKGWKERDHPLMDHPGAPRFDACTMEDGSFRIYAAAVDKFVGPQFPTFEAACKMAQRFANRIRMMQIAEHILAGEDWS